MKSICMITLFTLLLIQSGYSQKKYASNETKEIIEKMITLMEEWRNGEI